MKEITPEQAQAIENGSDELFICPECKEWTSTEESCCGVGPAMEPDTDMER